MKTAFLLLGLLVIGQAATTTVSDENSVGEELVRQVTGMQDSIHNDQLANDELYFSQQTDCDTEIAFRISEIENANSALSASQNAQSKCENAKASAHNDLINASNYAANIQEILAQEAFKRAQDQLSFDVLINNQLNPALEALVGIYPIINGIGQEVVSFAQMTIHMNKLSSHMIKNKIITSFNSIVSLLIQQDTEEGDIAEDDLANILHLLYQIEDDLQDQKQVVIDANNAQIENYNQFVLQYNDILTNLAVVTENINTYLDELTSCVISETSVSNDATSKIEHNTDSLYHALDMCDALKSQYDNGKQARQEELILLTKLKSFIEEETSVFGNFGTDGQEALQQYQDSFAQTLSSQRISFLQKSFLRLKKSPISKFMCKSCKKGFLHKYMGF